MVYSSACPETIRSIPPACPSWNCGSLNMRALSASQAARLGNSTSITTVSNGPLLKSVRIRQRGAGSLPADRGACIIWVMPRDLARLAKPGLKHVAHHDHEAFPPRLDPRAARSVSMTSARGPVNHDGCVGG